jgi:hypothetical protein
MSIGTQKEPRIGMQKGPPKDEFLLAATVQNLRKLARFLAYHPPMPAGCPA